MYREGLDEEGREDFDALLAEADQTRDPIEWETKVAVMGGDFIAS